VLAGIKSAGKTCLLVEQNYHLATALADYVYVLSQGRVMFSGTPTELSENDGVRLKYLTA
jgi:branched-chain amino acid transport system ATP-binding protein